MWEAILVVLLGLRPCELDRETPEDRRARLEVVSQSVEYAAARATCSGAFAEWVECQPIWRRSRSELTALLVTVAYEESKLALHVHAGRCRDHECDAISSGGSIVHRARSLWQVHYSPAFREEWENIPGTTLWQTSDAAWAATRVLAMGERRCGTVLGSLAGYLGLPNCRGEPALRRLVMAERIEREIGNIEQSLAAQVQIVAAPAPAGVAWAAKGSVSEGGLL